MPELPDVELFKRRLDATSLHQTIDRVAVVDARILAGVSAQEMGVRLAGRRLDHSRRHGKHLFVAFDSAGWLALHFGMTGGLEYFADMDREPPYSRLRLDFANGRHLAYTSRRMLGHVALADDPDAFIRARGIGPDALDPAFDAAAFRDAVGGRRRSVKSALMDQEVVAGIGNIYSDEILFQAGLHPESRIDRLAPDRVERLFDRAKEVLETAIACGAGSEQFLDRLPAHYLLPHRRKGGTCPRCGGDVRALKVSGRTGYYCPACQDGLRSRAATRRG